MKKILLNSGQFAIVDDDDFERLNSEKWYLAGRGYAYTSRGKLKMHRLVVNAPDGKSVDHINGNKLDNSRSNLRVCDHVENMQNIVHHEYKLGKGIERVYSKRKTKKRFMVRAKYMGKRYFAGYFETIEQAIEARDELYSKLRLSAGR